MREPSAIEVIVGWLDAMRRADLGAAGEWFDPAVVWRGIPADAICTDRESVLDMLGDHFVPCPDDPGASELEHPGLRGAESLELIGAGPEVAVLGAKLPGMTEVGEIAVDEQLFNVFRVHGGRIVAVTDYATRAEALAAANGQAPRWT